MSTQELAQSLLETLRPGCERIEIAGSIRRGKANPKDIELLAVPSTQRGFSDCDLFGDPIEFRELSLLEERIVAVCTTGGWEFDRVLRRNGEKYKRLRHLVTGVCCDLFIVTAETWGAQFVIRTGPADFSHMLVTRALRLGMQQADGRLWRTHRDGTRTVIETPEEIDYFRALGMDYIAPELRGKVTA